MRIVFTMWLAFLLHGLGFSQSADLQVISSAGGNFNGLMMQQSWTLGETVIETVAGPGVMFTQGFQQSDMMRMLSGQLTYDNLAHTPLTNTVVTLKKAGMIAHQTTTDNAGNYLFKDLPNGNYQLNGLCNKPWGGVNATDALIIMKHFANITALSGIRLEAADANGTGSVNALDALVVSRRFVGYLTSFPVGDWIFEKHNVLVNGFSNLTDNFKGICTGDVNGTYNPAGLKLETTLSLRDDRSVIKVNNDELIKVPVLVKDAVTLAAVSLVLNFPADQVVVKEVSTVVDNQNLVFNVLDGELRISWFTLAPLSLQAGEPLLNISLQCKWDAGNAARDLHFNIGQESEFGDYSGAVLEHKVLEMPVLIRDDAGFYLGQNVPNPGSELTVIQFSLPESGRVNLSYTNSIGQEIQILLSADMEAGTHTYSMDCHQIPAGVYLYSMRYESGNQTYTSTRRMVIVH